METHLDLCTDLHFVGLQLTSYFAQVTSWADEESDEEWQTVDKKKHERRPPEPSPPLSWTAASNFVAFFPQSLITIHKI